MNDTSLLPRGGLQPGRCWPILLALLPLAPARAQCPASVGSAWLESGDVRALTAVPGVLWGYQAVTGERKYRVPAGAVWEGPDGDLPLSTYLTAGLWIGGIDGGGQLRLAANTYRQTGTDFWPGPLDATGAPLADGCTDYDHVWGVSCAAIEAHALRVPPIAPADIDPGILTWPALGNPFAEGAGGAALAITDALAPFLDRDGDGVYDPTKGDVPDVPGDRAQFWVFNDAAGLHGETGADALGIEVRAMAWTWDGTPFDQQTFYRFTVDLPAGALTDVRLGLFADPDLGWYADDYVGFDTTRHLAYAYTADGFDGVPDRFDSIYGYGTDPPVAGVQWLAAPGGAGMALGLVTGNDFGPQGNPLTAADYWRLLNGRWIDDSPLTAGDEGYGGSVPVPVLFPDAPTDPAGWSACSANAPIRDRRHLQVSAPFALSAGETATLDFAVLHQAMQGVSDCAVDLVPLQDLADLVAGRYASEITTGNGCADALPPLPTGLPALADADWWLGPNPSDGPLAVRLSPGAAERLAGGRWVLLDAFGRRLAEGPVASGTLLDGAGLGAGAYRLQWRDAAGRPAGGRTWIRR